jgi:hypothetical protein
MTSTESKVLDTSTFWSGSFLNTNVIPLDAETTRIKIARRLRRDRRIVMGTSKGWEASSGVERGKIEEEARLGL